MSNTDNLVNSSVLTFDLPFMINLPDCQYPVNTEDYQAIVYLICTRSPTDMPGLPKNTSFPPDTYQEGEIGCRGLLIQSKHNQN